MRRDASDVLPLQFHPSAAPRPSFFPLVAASDRVIKNEDKKAWRNEFNTKNGTPARVTELKRLTIRPLLNRDAIGEQKGGSPRREKRDRATGYEVNDIQQEVSALME